MKNNIIKLGDFGIIYDIKYLNSLTDDKQLLINYMSPEVLNENEHYFNSDIWSESLLLLLSI